MKNIAILSLLLLVSCKPSPQLITEKHYCPAHSVSLVRTKYVDTRLVKEVHTEHFEDTYAIETVNSKGAHKVIAVSKQQYDTLKIGRIYAENEKK